MSAENVELVNEWVALDAILPQFEGSTLLNAEKIIAAEAIQLDRAQFTVDAIATELTSRLNENTESSSNLLQQVADLVAEANTIRRVLNREAEPEAEKPKTETDEAWDRLKDITRYSAFQRAVENEPPFKLWLRDPITDQKVDYKWRDEHEEEFKARFGGSFTHALPRIINTLLLHKLAMEKMGGFVNPGTVKYIKNDDMEVVAVEVTDAQNFINGVMSFDSIGLSCARATLVLAYYQKEQYSLTDNTDLLK